MKRMNRKSLNSKSSNEIFQLKVTLNNSLPKVWRRVLVPADYTFFDLHCAIQDSMGWTDSHLHGFRVVQEGKSKHEFISILFPDPESESWLKIDKGRDERVEYIADYLGKVAKRCQYEYDFGDGWEHTILFERSLPREEGLYPRCIAGKNACPPEDCGGVWGYEHLQKILRNPSHKEHADTLEWLGIDDLKEFDPSDFNPGDIKFINPKKRLKEFEEGFGVKPVSYLKR